MILRIERLPFIVKIRFFSYFIPEHSEFYRGQPITPKIRNSKILKVFAVIFTNLVLFLILDRTLYFLFIKEPEILNYSFDSYASNYRNYFRDSAINEHGHEIFYIDRSMEKNRDYQNFQFPENSFQILAIGDSFTYGQGIYLEDTYIKQLEAIFRAKENKNVFGVNLGISGIDVFQIYKQLEERIPHYSPKYVIYAYVLNDTILNENNTNDVTRIESRPSPDASWSAPGIDLINTRPEVVEEVLDDQKSFLDHFSKLYLHAKNSYIQSKLTEQTIAHYQDLHDPAKNKRGLVQTIEIIEKMNEISAKKGAKFLVAIYPLIYMTQKDYPFLSSHKTLRKMLEEKNIATIDLYEAFAGKKDADLWVHPIDQHPNNVAQEIAAEQIYKWIKKNP